jgi:erythromycin esterase-like protein
MKKIFLTLLFSAFHFISNGQNTTLKVLNLPENPTNDDFSFLKEELKGVQVLMLGEKTHFDGNVFEMKTKIIQYLHQELGFNTIAFESGVYDVWMAQNEINKGTYVQQALKNSLFSIWSETNEFQSFVRFYDANKSNLKLFGFDNQITGKYGEETLFINLFEYCNTNQLELKLDRGDLELLIESINSSSVFDENDISYSQYKSSFENLLKAIAKKPKTEASFYWTQTIKSLLALGENCYSKKAQILSPFIPTSDYNIRDKQMADNLLEYIKTHPNEKIICWGANQHFVNDMSSVSTPVLKDFVPMGSYIKKTLKENVYSLAAVTAADSIFLGGKWNKTLIDNKSFEYYLRSKKTPHMFISSKQEEMEKPQLNRLFSPEFFVEAKLNSIHDGYFYFNTVSRPTSIARNENDLETTNKVHFANNDNLPISNNQEKPNEKRIALNEVIVRSKKHPYTIVKKAIENRIKNYPSKDFNSQLTSNIDVKVQDTTMLNLDFMAKQYEFGYDKENRSYYQLKEIRWNTKNGYEPKGIRTEFYNVYIGNPIIFGRYLNQKKFKKFVFKEDDEIIYNNKEVYVIQFSTLRDQYSYTHRRFLCDFSGTLFINKDDYAIVKVIERLDVKKYENSYDREFELLGWPQKYVQKESTVEITETDFKKIDNLYYVSRVKNDIYGNLVDKDNRTHPFQIVVNSFWNDFNVLKPEKFTYKQEQTFFEKAPYNKIFWDNYEFPK